MSFYHRVQGLAATVISGSRYGESGWVVGRFLDEDNQLKGYDVVFPDMENDGLFYGPEELEF